MTVSRQSEDNLSVKGFCKSNVDSMQLLFGIPFYHYCQQGTRPACQAELEGIIDVLIDMFSTEIKVNLDIPPIDYLDTTTCSGYQ